MKNLKFVLILILVGSAAAAALAPGQCISDPMTKNYLQSIKATQNGTYNSMISEIGVEKLLSLKDTATTQYYFCQVTCANADGVPEKMWITQSDSVANFANMNGFLCHSVSIENVVIVGSITSPQPVATPFYSFNTSFPEIHKWLKNSKFMLSESATKAHWQEFQKTVNTVAIAYINSKAPALMMAGTQLWEIANQTEIGQLNLEIKLKQYAEVDWQMAQDFQNPDFLVFNTIRTFGRFLQYRYQAPAPAPPVHLQPLEYSLPLPALGL